MSDFKPKHSSKIAENRIPSLFNMIRVVFGLTFKTTSFTSICLQYLLENFTSILSDINIDRPTHFPVKITRSDVSFFGLKVYFCDIYSLSSSKLFQKPTHPQISFRLKISDKILQVFPSKPKMFLFSVKSVFFRDICLL